MGELNFDEMYKIMEILENYFYIYDYKINETSLQFYVYPKFGKESFKVLSTILPKLPKNYGIELKPTHGHVLIEIKKEKNGKILNIILLIATVMSTTLTGSTFYGKFDLIGGFIFSLAVMFVLGSHEMGHYLVAKRWRMRTSLPYFIPFPTIIGTLGAVIKYKGIIPNRRALFDVGVAGPLTGIAAAVIVLFIGLKLPFKPEIHGKGEVLLLGNSPLFSLIATLAGFKSNSFIHPIAFAGWIGLFVTFINLIPVGQLDGGHILRAMIGKYSDVVSRIIPFLLIAAGLYIGSYSGHFWIMWGLITMFFSLYPHPGPVDDDTPLDKKRYAIGILTFILGLACFTPEFLSYSEIT